jgi:hypothetical protein
MLLGSNTLFAQNAILEFPESLQLFTRNKQDSAAIEIAFESSSNDLSYSLIVSKGVDRYKYLSSANNKELIRFTPTIHAELSEYGFQLFAHRSNNDSTLIISAKKVLCGDAYVFYGQSNAAGTQSTSAVEKIISDKFIRSYRYSPNERGSPSYWCTGHYGAQNMGIFAISFANEIVQKNKYPVAIINASQGGFSISALNDRIEIEKTSPYTTYGLMLLRIQRSKIKTIKSLIWLQGENESNSDAFTINQYPEQLISLHKNLFEDLSILESFTIIQVNILGGIPFVWETGKLRDFQRYYASQFTKTYLLATAGIWENDGIHYYTEGYVELGKHLHVLANNKFYDSTDSMSTTAPNIQKVINQQSQKRLKLVFDINQNFQFDAILQYSHYFRNLKDYIYCGRSTGFVDSIQYDKNIIYIYYNHLNDSTLTYLPPKLNDDYSPSYNGPTFKNSKGLHAATFYEIPILPEMLVLEIEVLAPEIESSIIDRTKTKVIFNLMTPSFNCANCKVVINQLDVSNNSLIKTASNNFNQNNCYLFNNEHPGRNNNLNFELFYVLENIESERTFYSINLSPIIEKPRSFKTFPTSVYNFKNNSISAIQGFVLNSEEFINTQTLNCSNSN